MSANAFCAARPAKKPEQRARKIRVDTFELPWALRAGNFPLIRVSSAA
jgi:hypothetical protein